jgi:hypothetical protein
LEWENTAERVINQKELEIAKLARSTITRQKEHEIAQRAIEDAKKREHQLILYSEASEQFQQGEQQRLFTEAVAERSRLETQCQQLTARIHSSEYQAMMTQMGAANHGQELQEQQRKIGILYGENASMARQSFAQESRFADCDKELRAWKSEEEACQQESPRLRNEVGVAEAHVEIWQETAHQHQESLEKAWAEVEFMKKQRTDAEESEAKFDPSSSNHGPDLEANHKKSEVAEKTDARPTRKIKEADKIDVPALPTILTVSAWKTRLINQVLVASGNPDLKRVIMWISKSW